MEVVRSAREYSDGAILFHQAAGDLLGVNATDMRCLDVIMLEGSANPTRLAGRTGLTTGATTAMLDRLEKGGLIERHPDPEDRRGTVVVLSKGGARMLQGLFRSMADAVEALAAGYSEKQLEVLADFFAKASVLWKDEREKLARRAEGARKARG